MPPPGLDAALAVQRPIPLYETARNLGPEVTRAPHLVSEHFRGRVAIGAAISEADYKAALVERSRLVEAVRGWAAACDAILIPPAPGEAPGLETTGDPRLCARWSGRRRSASPPAGARAGCRSGCSSARRPARTGARRGRLGGASAGGKPRIARTDIGESGERGVLAPLSAAGDSCHRWLGWIPDVRRVRRAGRLSPYPESVCSPATTSPDRLPREEEPNRQR